MESSLPSLNEAPPKAASLLGLAVEIRSEILKHLVGGVIFHVSCGRTRRPAKAIDEWFTTYSYFVCRDVNAEEAMVRNKTESHWKCSRGGRTCEYLTSDEQWDHLKFERDDRIARRCFHKAIARANRQLYKESCWAFLEYNTFSFCEPLAWQLFRDDHSAAQLNHVRAIELCTMTPELDTEKGFDERDPYERTLQDCCWRFDNIGILKNVTTIVLGLRQPHENYKGMLGLEIETIVQALKWAYGDLGGLKRLKEAEVFIIVDRMWWLDGGFFSMEDAEQIKNLISVLASNLEAKLLACNPHNIAQPMHEEETDPRN